ncbi:MAG: hypothetical protein ACK52I_21915 [Pseudomonadota bacterium]
MKPQETVKDRARQAYLDQQTQDSEGGCGQPIGFIYGFIAGEESAQSRIKTLESALVDMAKALEYMDNLPRGATTDRGYRALSKHQELLSELGKDGK